jgi:HD superfamily phosphohydrolase
MAGDKEESQDNYQVGLLRELFSPHKTIRDPVHGDIYLTRLEVKIIDTPIFQRLRGIRQLGTTYLVYPGARHSRFEHSIGCLYMTQKIIDCVNNNPYPDIIISDYDKLLLRLTALIHDLSHIPFGHTLEDEGQLFKGDDQWTDVARRDYFLSNKRGIPRIIIGDPTLKKISLIDKRYEPTKILNEIRNIIKGTERDKEKGNTQKEDDRKTEKPNEFENLYLCDIIGNTLCADLLDYVRRDLYYTGLKGDYDDRLLTYLYVTRVPKSDNKPRLVLRLKKPRTGAKRRDILSELLTLLRLRYSLAEKVYFHHAKCSSSAMVISAVTDMQVQGKLKKSDLYPMSDDSLLERMADSGTGTIISRYLIGHLKRHSFYKPCYGFKLKPLPPGDVDYVRRRDAVNEMHVPKLRWRWERSLEAVNGLKAGSVVVYCPKTGGGAKPIETIIDFGETEKELDTLSEIGKKKKKEIGDEITASITERHEEIPVFCVFVKNNLPERKFRDIFGDCLEKFGLRNEIPECDKYRKDHYDRWPKRYDEKYKKEYKEAGNYEADEIFEKVEATAERNADFKTEGENKYYIPSYDEYKATRRDIEIKEGDTSLFRLDDA